MKRTFIAFDIIPAAETAIAYAQIRQKLRLEKINWVQDTAFHMTLKFLGDTPEELIPDIIESLKDMVARFKSFHIRLEGLGIFKNLHDPRVIWMGCEFEPSLDKIRQETERLLTAFGYNLDDRRFSPHLTLGRIKQIRQSNQLAELVAHYKDTKFQEQQVNEILFYESRLTPSGSIYTPLWKGKLIG